MARVKKTKKNARATHATRSAPKNKPLLKAVTVTNAWQPIFIEALRTRGIVKDACIEAKVDRSTAYRHREEDKEFADKWDLALEDARDDIDAEIHRRAVLGWEEPVFGNLGQFRGSGQIGTIRRYSDGLLSLLAKASRPSKYREHVSHEHTGKDGGPIAVKQDLGTLSDAELDQLGTLVAKATASPAALANTDGN